MPVYICPHSLQQGILHNHNQVLEPSNYQMLKLQVVLMIMILEVSTMLSIFFNFQPLHCRHLQSFHQFDHQNLHAHHLALDIKGMDRVLEVLIRALHHITHFQYKVDVFDDRHSSYHLEP